MRQRTPNAARLAIFWFGIQIVWGALLGVSLQARASALAPGFALAAYPLLAGCGAAVAAVTQIAAGIVSDRRTRRGSTRVEFYALGVVIAAGGIVWFYAAPSFAQAFFAVLALQFGMNVAIGPYQAAIPDFIHDERAGAASSWMAALQSFGNACGAVIAGLVANGLVVAIAIVAALVASCALTSSHVARLARVQVPEVLRDNDARSVYVNLFVSRAFVYLGFYTLLGYLFFFVQETLGRAHAKPLTAYTLLAVTLAGVVGAAVAARPADRFDQRAVASIGAACFIVSIVAFIVSRGAGQYIACAALAGTAWGVFLTADWALGCRLIPKMHAATALGVWNLALLAPQVAAPFAASAVMHAVPPVTPARAAFALAAIEVLVGAVWVWRLPARD